MTDQIDYDTLLYTRTASTIKVHGIMSIIFGSLGVLSGALFTLILIISTYADPEFDATNSTLGLFIVSAIAFVFWTLPHIYLIVAGSYLVKDPSPRVAKTLIIINLVIGVFWNWVLLIFAIINLTQFSDYERSYHTHKR